MLIGFIAKEKVVGVGEVGGFVGGFENQLYTGTAEFFVDIFYNVHTGEGFTFLIFFSLCRCIPK